MSSYGRKEFPNVCAQGLTEEFFSGVLVGEILRGEAGYGVKLRTGYLVSVRVEHNRNGSSSSHWCAIHRGRPESPLFYGQFRRSSQHSCSINGFS